MNTQKDNPMGLHLRRVVPGHLVIVGEYIADDPEIFGEILLIGSRKWVVRLWHWGTPKPGPWTGFQDLVFPSLEDAKTYLIQCIDENQPQPRIRK